MARKVRSKTAEFAKHLIIITALIFAFIPFYLMLNISLKDDEQFFQNPRLPSLPSFHRAEGGAAFTRHFRDGERRLVRLRLQYCLPPLRACLMFGDPANNHLDEITLEI